MKISGRKSVGGATPITGSQRVANKPKVDGAANIDPRATDVRISSTAGEIDRVKQAVLDVPEVRVEKVQEIKPMVDDGSYQVESGVIAKKMVDESLRESARVKKGRRR